MNNFPKSQVLVLLLFLLPLLLFFDIIFSYFSQDDFFHLRVVMDKKWSDIPQFFISMQAEYAFYRPLSRETLNLVMYKLFGLNPLPFHIFNLAVISADTFLLWRLTRSLTGNFAISVLAVLLYAASTIHSIELYYLASVQTLLATFFLLACLLQYISFLKTGHIKNYVLSYFFFLLALFSHETAIILPAILFLMEFFIRKKGLVVRLLPFVALAIIYLARTSLLTGLPDQQVYRPIFQPRSIVNTLGWYSMWNFGLSEILVDFIGPKFHINPNLFKWYGQYVTTSVSLFAFLVLSLTFLLIIIKKIIKVRLLGLLAVSYIAALSPFLLFPHHKSSYYLTFSTVWFSAFLAVILASAWGFAKTVKIAVILFIAAFIILSYQTTRLNRLTYWAAKRAGAAKFLISDIQAKYPHIDKGATFYIKNDPNYPKIAEQWGNSSQQAFYILSGSDAFKLLYNDPEVEVYFEDRKNLPQNISKPIIEYTAKFPY